MLNSHLIGRIGKDAEIKSKNGKSYMTMDVATDFYSKGENKTMWVRIISSDSTIIEKRAKYFTKGSLVTIEGHQLEPSAWVGNDGKARAQIVIVADFIEFVRIGKKRDASTQEPQQATVTVEQTVHTEDKPFPSTDDQSEELPF